MVMRSQSKKPELLVPAGGWETLCVAVHYGADAVYIGGDAFSLRAKADNFSPEDMERAIRFAHEHGVQVFVAVNILAHNADLPEMRNYLKTLEKLRPDGLIIADPGVFMLAEEICPDIPRHISTQANNTNYGTFRFWAEQGAARVVAARELSLSEIRDLHDRLKGSVEIEVFVHGAMCISYSGRCLLSNFLTGRDANRGACTHPCRWKYRLYRSDPAAAEEEEKNSSADVQERASAGKGIGEEHKDTSADDPSVCYVSEETRPGEFFPVVETERGTFLFNSRDLCMIEYIPELIGAGIDSFKIEGRMKTSLYVATVTRAYRQAIDACLKDPSEYSADLKKWCMKEISGTTNRRFTTGFFFGKPTEQDQIYDSSTYVSETTYIGMVQKTDENGRIVIEQKNKFFRNDILEVLRPDGKTPRYRVRGIYDAEGNSMESAPHARQELHLDLEALSDSDEIQQFDVLRMRKA
ncbi:MAG: U32 family peptidase [Eubacterium sp.]|nr:U32 family peptidase [Eubacterium sp.]